MKRGTKLIATKATHSAPSSAYASLESTDPSITQNVYYGVALRGERAREQQHAKYTPSAFWPVLY